MLRHRSRRPPLAECIVPRPFDSTFPRIIHSGGSTAFGVQTCKHATTLYLPAEITRIVKWASPPAVRSMTKAGSP